MNSSTQSPPLKNSHPTTPVIGQWHGHAADDVGATFGPEPMASLTATTQELVLTSPRGTYQIPRGAVTRIGRGGLYPWFFRSVGIRHNTPGVPSDLQFKPLDRSRQDVVERLRALGYPVR